MIGPGTQASRHPRVLLDRKATAQARTMSVFGHQRSSSDFVYADELNALKTSGLCRDCRGMVPRRRPRSLRA